ncbi:MAG: thioredoxin domain-containing protein [Acidobacteria bacterium]|nr:thioredoxin domain-containing protein [Acidobacteriota bacterium]
MIRRALHSKQRGPLSVHTNRLIHEKSPYLLQHAHNPVDWYPWGEEAFAKARAEDKPIFLSIGYSTCHWCHVMERESFESGETAALLNRHFVPVKVDREERPDIDRVYMFFVQATTGGGGWPMSVFLTPDLQPFFGGTYFPPDNRYGRPGFPALLRGLSEAWANDRTRVVESGGEVVGQLRRYAAAAPGSAPGPDDSIAEAAFRSFQRGYDAEFGGFGGAPKFPQPSVHNFLLRYGARSGDQEAAGMVLATLEAMAQGGIHDRLAGGFHRYSVDERWFVPHFEKMLYDQAQLAVSYLEAYQVTGRESYAGVARRILDYVLREMTHPDGGFYSAEDADSAADSARPSEKNEGAFYIWSRAEIEGIVGTPAAGWFRHRYGVEAEGNVAMDPHGEFRGRNILFEAHSLEDTAERFGLEPARLAAALEDARAKLLAARARRPRPHLDDKILTAWNGLMISAFARAAQTLDDPRFAEAARRAAAFVLDRLYDPAAGTLLRRYRDGESAIPACLEDYAFFAQALLDLYETDFEPDRLELALRLMETARDRFEDREHGGFFSTVESGELILRLKEDHDGAEPSANSIAALNLLRLAEIMGREDLRRSAERTLQSVAERLKEAPTAVPRMLAAWLRAQAPPRQVVIAGQRDAPDTRALVAEVRRGFRPDVLLLVADGEARNPLLAGMHPLGGKAAAYVCQNFVCREPVTEPGKLKELLKDLRVPTSRQSVSLRFRHLHGQP